VFEEIKSVSRLPGALSQTPLSYLTAKWVRVLDIQHANQVSNKQTKINRTGNSIDAEITDFGEKLFT
tara:strand:- start:871 stop:1071 length:201 start_codon:yes stop_codon:yes gene_type:complete